MKNLTKSFVILLMCVCVSNSFAAQVKKAKAVGKDTTITSEGFSYQITPTPAFVINDIQAPISPNQDYGDVVFKLMDRQISLVGQIPQEYVHFKSEALSASALQDSSQVYVTFNPAYQKLYLHGIHVWRNGKSIDLTRSVKLDLIRRESNLENNMYQGEVTAIGVLPDIRINDVVDLEYTVTGLNPIFGKRYADTFSISQFAPVDQFRLVVTTPENRPLKIQPPAGLAFKEEMKGNSIRYTVERGNIKALVSEDKTPDWYQAGQMVQISEYQDWKQVADWATGLFKVESDFSPEIQQQLQVWKASKLPKEQLAVEVLRWVQTQIRYFGIELGQNSHLPSQPNQTVDRKFGDCKDKSLLLSSLLKALDIDAQPTLASTKYLRNIEKMIPSHAVFDHAIVRVTFDGRSYWLDPTFPAQYGSLEKLGITDFGYVLPLGVNGNGQLQSATYPPNYEASYFTTNSYKLTKFNEPVQLTSRIKSTFRTAEYLRFAHEKQAKEEFNKGFQENIKRVYPQAKLNGEPEFIDDRINNEITIVARYTIEDFLKYEPGSLGSVFYGIEILGSSNLPKIIQRTTPFALPVKTKVTQIEEFEFPTEANITPAKANDTKTGEFWTFTSNTTLTNQKATQIWTLKSNKESVSPQKMEDLNVESKAFRERLVMTFKLPAGKITEADNRRGGAEYLRLSNKYGSTSSGRVGLQKKDIVNYFLTTRDIESGKLFGKNLGEALKIRSQVYDNQGDVKRALEDIRAAELLAPDDLDYKLSEADTLLGDGQFKAANALYEKVIASEKVTDQQRQAALKAYGQSSHYLGDKKAAIESLNQSFNLQDEPSAIYVALWQYLVSDPDEVSRNELKQRMDSIQDHSWPYQVGEAFLGKLSPEQLIAAGSSPDKGVQEDQYCEAYFFLGKYFAREGRKDKAQEYFQKSISQGVGPYLENNLSFVELGRKKSVSNNSWFK